MRIVGSTALLLLLLVGSVHADENVLEDAEYRFRLQSPGPGWRVMDSEAIQAFVPDAVAGLLSPRGVWCAIIAESAPGVELEGFTRLVLDNMGLERKNVEAFDATTVQGKPGFRFVVSGYVEEVHVRYVNTMFRNGDFVFQLICWTAYERATKGFHEPALRAFTITPGKVTGRSRTRKVPDSEGVGWLVRDGTFKSAALRVAVEPQKGWGVAVGAELEEMNGDAEVGLVHSVPDVYMVLIVERAVGVDKKTYAERAMNSWAEGVDPKPNGQTLKAKVGPHDVTFQGFAHGTNTEFEFLKGVFFQGDLCMQALFWYGVSSRKDALAVIPDGIQSLKLLSEEETRLVAEELERGPDPENQVGAAFALRRGLYRDFEAHFTFQKPPGEYWRVHAGMGARARNSDARLYMEHPTLGISGLVIVEPKGQFTNETFHEVVTGSMFGKEAPAVTEGGQQITLDGGKALATQSNLTTQGLELRYFVVTTVRHGFAYQFIFYGLEPNVRASTRAIATVVRGFRFDNTMKAQIVKDGLVSDARLGFGFKPSLPGSGWRHRDMTPASIAPIGTFHAWAQRDGAVMLMALCAMQPGQDGAWFRNVMAQTAKQRFGPLLRSSPTMSKSTLAGLPADRQTWKAGDNTNEMFLLTRDRTFYALFIMHKNGFTAEQVEAIRGAFKLLD
ncbi:MAG: hypothetical protein QNJ98_14330 [Planctomycetota bacterium]|nr:hypothetical protein [Planctomycetota bacterium]